MSDRVGPVIIPHSGARWQLANHGKLVVFRGDRGTGETWWTDALGTSKDGDCVVERLGEAEPSTDDLELLQLMSGFSSTASWIEAIDELHDGDSGYLYLVTEVSESDE